MKFGYVNYEMDDGTIIARPVIECCVINPESRKGLIVMGLLDSGSDVILRSTGLADYLGYDWENSKTHPVSGIGGEIQVVRKPMKLIRIEVPSI